MNPGLVGALTCGLAVVAGAFGAHALKERLTPDKLEVFETAVRYQMFHGLGLLALAALQRAGVTGLDRPAWCLLGGVVLFSGSLYGLVFGGPRWLGPVTPLGGLLFVAGWVWLALQLRGR